MDDHLAIGALFGPKLPNVVLSNRKSVQAQAVCALVSKVAQPAFYGYHPAGLSKLVSTGHFRLLGCTNTRARPKNCPLLYDTRNLFERQRAVEDC